MYIMYISQLLLYIHVLYNLESDHIVTHCEMYLATALVLFLEHVTSNGRYAVDEQLSLSSWERDITFNM